MSYSLRISISAVMRSTIFATLLTLRQANCKNNNNLWHAESEADGAVFRIYQFNFNHINAECSTPKQRKMN